MNFSLKSMCLALSLCASTILCGSSGQPSNWKFLSGLNLPSASSCSSFVTGLQGRTQSLFTSARVKYNEPLLAKDGENTRLTKGNVFLGASLFLSGLNFPSASSCSSFVTGLQDRTQSLFTSARVKYNEPLLAKDGENTRLTKGNVFLGASLFLGATGLLGWNVWRYRKKASQGATPQKKKAGSSAAGSALNVASRDKSKPLKSAGLTPQPLPKGSSQKKERLLQCEYNKNVDVYLRTINELTEWYKLTEKGKNELFHDLCYERYPFTYPYMLRFDNTRDK